jgi:hypothetical protein
MTSDVIDSRPMVAPCRMKAIDRWSETTHLAGIKTLGEGRWELDDNFFACCGGTGIEIQSLISRTARMCGLVERWAQLKAHLQFTADVFPSQLLTDIIGVSPTTKKSHMCTKTLEALARWRSLHARAIESNARGRLIADATELLPGLTITWAGVASCIWHDGIRVLLHLHGSGTPAIAKWQRELQNHPKMRTILIMERVHNLFDAGKLLECDEVISFAARNALPLWIVTGTVKASAQSAAPKSSPAESSSQASESPAPKSQKFSQALGRKMSGYRHAPLEQWLSAQTLARLREVCDLPSQSKASKDFIIPPVV